MDKDYLRTHYRVTSTGLVVRADESVIEHDEHEGYLWYFIQGEWMPAHRVVYVLAMGDLRPGMVIDHIDGNRLNNAPSNLRQLSIRENRLNQDTLHSGGGFHGVHYSKLHGSWTTTLVIKERQIRVYYETAPPTDEHAPLRCHAAYIVGVSEASAVSMVPYGALFSLSECRQILGDTNMRLIADRIRSAVCKASRPKDNFRKSPTPSLPKAPW